MSPMSTFVSCQTCSLTDCFCSSLTAQLLPEHVSGCFFSVLLFRFNDFFVCLNDFLPELRVFTDTFLWCFFSVFVYFPKLIIFVWLISKLINFFFGLIWSKYRVIRNTQTTNPNQQLTVGWYDGIRTIQPTKVSITSPLIHRLPEALPIWFPKCFVKSATMRLVDNSAVSSVVCWSFPNWWAQDKRYAFAIVNLGVSCRDEHSSPEKQTLD